MSDDDKTETCPDCGTVHSIYDEHEPNNCVPVLRTRLTAIEEGEDMTQHIEPRITFAVIREHLSEYYNRNTTAVVGMFKTLDEAISAARSTDNYRSRIIIQVVGWEDWT